MITDKIEGPTNVIIGRIERANRTYFFERHDGSIISAQGKEAWNLYSRHPQIVGTRVPPYKFIGSSDGLTFQKAVEESQAVFRNTGNLEEAQKILRAGEQEELNKARGNMIPPPNMDKMGPAGHLI